MTRRTARPRRRKRTKNPVPAPSPLPKWFVVDNPPTWEEVVSTPKLFAGIWRKVRTASADRWRDPRLDWALQRARVEFIVNLRKWTTEFRSVDLTRLPTPQLVAAFQHAYWGETAIGNVVPRSYNPDRVVRIAAAYETLLAQGILSRADGTGGHPLDLARTVVTAQITNAPIWHEMLRRAESHVGGFAAAVLRLAHELSRLGIQADLAEPAAHVFGDSEHVSQALLTVHKEWGHLDPFQALEQALLGELDIAKTAVRRDVIDEERKTQRYQRRTVTVEFDEGGTIDDGRTVEGQLKRQAHDAWMENEQQERRRADLRLAIQEVCEENPGLKLDTYVTARQNDMNQKQAAEATGISSRTAREYEKILRTGLGTRSSDQ